MKKSFVFFTLLVFVTLVFSSTLLVKATGERKTEDELSGGTIAIEADTTGHFIPGFELVRGDLWVTMAVQDPLFRKLSGDRLSPGLVREWIWTEGNRKLRITLRDDIRWYDGTPITTRDFEYSVSVWSASKDSLLYDVLKDPATLEFSVIDERSVIFSFNRPFPEFIDYLSVGLLAKHVYADRLGLKPEEFSESRYMAYPPIEATSGPFFLDSNSKKGEISLKRNPLWHGDKMSPHLPLFFDDWPKKALLDEIKLIEVNNSEERVAMFKAGSLSLVFGEEEYTAGLLREAENGSYNYSMYPDGSYHAIILNHRNETLSNRSVRRALRMAIDFDSLLNLLAPNSIKAFLPLDPRTGLLKDLESQIADLEYDVDLARDLLQREGYSQRITLTLKAYLGVPKGFTDSLARMWKEIGVDLRVERVDWITLLSDISTANYDMVYLRLDALDYPEISPWTVEYDYELKSGWDTGYVNPQLVRIARRAASEPEWIGRLPFYLGAYRIWTQDVPIIVLSYNRRPLFWRSDLSGPATGFGELYWNLAEWHLQSR